MRSKDTVFIQAEGGSLSVSPPVTFNGARSSLRAELETDDQLFTLSPVDAELLARTIAPQLFEQPDPGPLQAIYEDLYETEASYSNELAASVEGSWRTSDLQDSMSSLLGALRNSLAKLQELLPDE